MYLQNATYNNVKSDKENVKCGVPQGSILGLLLSLPYMNDLTTVSTTSLSVLFADDTYLCQAKIYNLCLWHQMSS